MQSFLSSIQVRKNQITGDVRFAESTEKSLKCNHSIVSKNKTQLILTRLCVLLQNNINLTVSLHSLKIYRKIFTGLLHYSAITFYTNIFENVDLQLSASLQEFLYRLYPSFLSTFFTAFGFSTCPFYTTKSWKGVINVETMDGMDDWQFRSLGTSRYHMKFQSPHRRLSLMQSTDWVRVKCGQNLHFTPNTQ